MNEILKDILYTDDYIKEQGQGIFDNTIVSVDISIEGHFGNAVCTTINMNNSRPVGMINNVLNVGAQIQSLVELLGIDEDNGISLSEIRNIPIRTIHVEDDRYSSIIGFGHQFSDRFVYIKDFNSLMIEPGIYEKTYDTTRRGKNEYYRV